MTDDPFLADVAALFTEPCADEDFARRLWGSLANVEWILP